MGRATLIKKQGVKVLGDTVKVAVLELNGVEYSTPTERILDAGDCKFTAPGFMATDANAAIVEAKGTAVNLPRFTLTLIMNGITGNNDWITYSNLTPDSQIILASKCTLKELAWSNSKGGVSFDMVFYKNGRGTTPYVTRQVRSAAGVEHGYFAGLSDAFDPGDTLDIKYIDQGQNARDLVVVLVFQVEEI